MKNRLTEADIDVDSLKKIAIYLEGIKQGRGGNIHPLGTYDLEQLRNAIEWNHNQ